MITRPLSHLFLICCKDTTYNAIKSSIFVYKGLISVNSRIFNSIYRFSHIFLIVFHAFSTCSTIFSAKS